MAANPDDFDQQLMGALDRAFPKQSGNDPLLSALDTAFPRPDPGFFKSIGTSALGSAGSGIAGVGTALEDVGLQRLGTPVREYGEGIQQANPSSISQFSDILDKPKQFAGEALGQIGSSIAATGGGALIGRGLGTAIGAALPIPGAAPALGALGSLAGGFASNLAGEYGETRANQREMGFNDPTRALAAAVPAAALDYAADRYVGKIGKLGQLDAIPQGMKRPEFMAREALKGALIEGPITEVPQTVLERLGGGKDIASNEALNEYGIAGVMGALGGGVVSGGIGGFAPYAPPTQQDQPAITPEQPAEPQQPMGLGSQWETPTFTLRPNEPVMQPEEAATVQNPLTVEPATEQPPAVEPQGLGSQWQKPAFTLNPNQPVLGDVLAGAPDESTQAPVAPGTDRVGSPGPEATAVDPVAASGPDAGNEPRDGLLSSTRQFNTAPGLATDPAPAAPVGGNVAGSPGAEAGQPNRNVLDAGQGAVDEAQDTGLVGEAQVRQASSLGSLADDLDNYIAGETAKMNDWAGRQYRGNRNVINFEGDGPARNETLSVGSINENRRRRVVEQSGQNIANTEKLKRAIEQNPDEFVRQMDELEQQMAEVERVSGVPKTPEDYDMAVFSTFFGSQRGGATSGEKSIGRAIRNAYAAEKERRQQQTTQNEADEAKRIADAQARMEADPENWLSAMFGTEPEQPPARGREEVTGTTEPPIADRTVFDGMPEEAEATPWQKLPEQSILPNIPVRELRDLRKRAQDLLETEGDKPLRVDLGNGRAVDTIATQRPVYEKYLSAIDEAIQQNTRPDTRPTNPRQTLQGLQSKADEYQFNKRYDERKQEVDTLQQSITDKIKALSEEAKARRAAGEDEQAIRADLDEQYKTGLQHLNWLKSNANTAYRYDANGQPTGELNPRNKEAEYARIPDAIRQYAGVQDGQPTQEPTDAAPTPRDLGSDATSLSGGSRPTRAGELGVAGGTELSGRGDSLDGAGGLGTESPAATGLDRVDSVNRPALAPQFTETDKDNRFKLTNVTDLGGTEAVRARLKEAGVKVPGNALDDNTLQFHSSQRDKVFNALTPEVANDEQNQLSRQPEQPARQEEGTQAQEEVGQYRRGEVGGKYASGEIVTTSSGRQTTPFPKVKLDTKRKVSNTLKSVDQWLLQNALEEARARGDEFNASGFEQDLKSTVIPPATKDAAEEYLFGEQPEVRPSMLKPLTRPDAPNQLAPTAPQAGQQPGADTAAQSDAPAGPQPISRDTELLDGATIYDKEGKPYRVYGKRNETVTAHPIVDGKPQVSKDTTVRFWVNPDPELNPPSENDRRDPIFTEPPTSNVTGNVSSTLAPTAEQEPWQMTREQYFNDQPRVRRDVLGGESQGYLVRYEYENPSPAGPFKGSMISKRPAQVGSSIAGAFGTAKVVSNRKTTGQPDVDLYEEGTAYHRRQVADALAAGKPVPASVLAEYPDLSPANAAPVTGEAPTLNLAQRGQFNGANAVRKAMGKPALTEAEWLAEQQGAPAETGQAAATAEQAIRDAADQVPSRTIGSWYPITVSHSDRTQQFMSNIKRVRSDGRTKPTISLAQVKPGRLIAGEPIKPLFYSYKLTKDNKLVEEGVPRYASDAEIKRWEKSFGKVGGEPQPAAEQPPQNLGQKLKANAAKPALTVYDDPRMKRPIYRNAIQSYGKELTPGGDIQYIRDANDRIIGRTASINPQWFQNLPAETKMSVKDAQKAIQKASAGEKLGVREQRLIRAILDEIQGERTAPKELDFARNKLEAQRQRQRQEREAAQAIRATLGLDDDESVNLGYEHLEDDYDADADHDARIIADLAEQYRSTPDADENWLDALLEKDAPDAEIARQLQEKINGRSQQEGAGDDTQVAGEAADQAGSELFGGLAESERPTAERLALEERQKELARQRDASQAPRGGGLFDIDNRQDDIFSEPAETPTNDRDSFTVERVEDDKPFTLTFKRGETVKVAGKYPMDTGTIDGISKANKQAKVLGVWFDFGYIYPADYDEYAGPRADALKQIGRIRQQLDSGSFVDVRDMVRDLDQQISKFGLTDLQEQADALKEQELQNRQAFTAKMEADREKQRERAAENERKRQAEAAAQDNSPIEMTMEEWKKIGKDAKGRLPDGTRSVLRDGRLRTVTIIKPEKAKRVVSDKAKAEQEQAATGAYTLESHRAFWKRVADGEVKADEFKATFAQYQAAKDDLKAELNQRTLKQLAPNGARGMTKARLIDEVVRDMGSRFSLSKSISYMLGAPGGYEAAVASAVEKITDADLESYAQRMAEDRAESQQRAEKVKAAIADPKTLEDFQLFMRSQMSEGKTQQQARQAMTPEQRAKYDELAASASRDARMARADQQKTQVNVTAQTTSGSVIETQHTRTGEALFVVQASDRVDRDTYNQWNTTAKRMGGYYSSFRGRGAVPGFQFKTRENADAFLAYLGGNAEQAQSAVQTRRDAFADDKSQSAVERLTTMADRLEEQADATLNADRKTNTARRVNMANAIEARANADKAMAKTMRNLAGAIASGQVKFLDRVRQKVQVEMLDRLTQRARAEELREQYPNYADRQNQEGKPPTGETIDYAAYPVFSAYRSDLARLGRALSEQEGTKKLSASILKVADDVTEAYLKFAKENLQKVSTFTRTNGEGAIFPSREAAEAAIRRSGYKGQAMVLQTRRGENVIIMSPSMARERGVWQGDDDSRVTLSGEIGAEIVAKAKRRDVPVPATFEGIAADRARLESMGIETLQELRAALREYVSYKQAPAEKDAIKAMERSMVGRANDGLDFFPTSADVVDDMLAAAEIEPGMTVLEPSAGMGHIADRIRENDVSLDVVEMSPSRRELLQAKGFNLVGDDFLQVSGSYDRILMNPPFSKRRDAEHVRHAYDLLKPGGRLVAIMGEGVFYGQDAKAREFRDWLESVGGTSEKLPEGTFMDPSLPVNTGVNARMVVVDKAEGERAMFSREARFSFAGQQAATADTMALSTAQQRLDAGESAETVRQETGWFKGKDGKWRFEINDADARYDADALQEMREIATNEGREFDPIQDRIPLGGVLNHPALFAAYPALSDMSVMFVPAKWSGLNGSHAAYAPSRNAIVMQDNLSDADALSALLHEIQHGIQTIEGFANGGSPYSAAAMYAQQNLKPRLDEINREMIDLGYKRQSLNGDAYIKSMARHRELVAEREAIEEELQSLETDAAPKYRIYNRLAGEVEARNVQTRQGMTDAERRSLSPQSTQDVADWETLVMFNGRVMANAPIPQNLAGRPVQQKVGAVLSRDAVQARIDAIRPKLRISPNVKILAVDSEAELPADIQAQARKEGAVGQVVAVHQGNSIYLVAGKHDSAAKVEESILHESNHYGANVAFGRAKHAIYNRLFNQLGGEKGIREYAKRLGLKMEPYFVTAREARGNLSDMRVNSYLVDEFLANAQGTKAYATLPQKIKTAIQEFYGAIRNWLRQQGFAELAKFTDADLAYLLRSIHQAAQGNAASGRGKPMFMVAFHGGPHDFDKFSTSKVGTGEGAQAFGYGLYFTNAKDIAEYYRDALRAKSSYNLSDKAKEYGFELNAGQRGEIVRQVTEGKEKGRDAAAIARSIQYAKANMRDIDQRSLARLIDDYIQNGFGRLYQVELAPAEDEYLLFDRRLSDLTGTAKAAIFEGGIDSIRGDAKFFSDLVKGKPFITQGFGGLDVPSQRRVLSRMFGASKNGEIFNSVVELIPVDVMNILVSEKLSPNVLLHDEAMLHNLLTASSDSRITRWADIATALVNAYTGATAEQVDRLSGTRPAPKFKSTNGTGTFNHVPIISELGQDATGKDLYQAISKKLGSDKAASEYLHTLGIRGIRYPAEGQTGGKSGDRYNFVIFDESDVSITAKFSRGRMSPMPDTTAPGPQGDAQQGAKKGDAVADFQDRLIAAQDMADAVRTTGQRLQIRGDGYVTLYHSTSNTAADSIRAAGKFTGNTWLSASKAATMDHARPKHGKNTTTLEIPVDPRTIEFSTGTGEFYAPNGLVRDENGYWSSPNDSPASDNTDAMFSRSPTINVDGTERPTTNSDGRPIHPTEEGLRNFWRWFSDSAVTDEQGRPLVVHHGSPDVRGIFAEGFKARSRGEVWFAAKDYAVANSYAIPERAFDFQNAEDQVIPLYLSLKNPLIVDAKGAFWRDTERHVDEAKQAGHDGIIIKNSVDFYNNPRGKGKTTTVYAWFNPAQAKSGVDGNLVSRVDRQPIPGATGNSGDFSPDNNDIRFSRQYTPEQQAVIDKFAAGQTMQQKPWRERVREVTDNWQTAWAQKVVDRYRSFRDILRNPELWMQARLAGQSEGAVHAGIHFGAPEWDAMGQAIQANLNTKPLEQINQDLGGEINDFFKWVAAQRADRINRKADTAAQMAEILGNDIAKLESQIEALSQAKGNQAERIAELQQQITETRREMNAARKAARIRERFLDDETIEAGLTFDEGTMPDGRDRATVYAQALKDFNKLNDAYVNLNVEAGAISEEDAERWRSEGVYVPFYRFLQDDEGNTSSRGLRDLASLDKQTAFKQFKGSAIPLNDLLSNVLANWHHLAHTATHNATAVKALEQASDMGLAERIPESQADDKSLWVREDGKKVFYRLANDSKDAKLVWESIQGMNYQGWKNGAMDAAQAMAGLLRAGVTANPVYRYRNLIRDTMQALATSNVPLNAVVKGWQQTGPKTIEEIQRYANMLASGGLFGIHEAGYLREGNPGAANAKAMLKLGAKPDTDNAILLTQGALMKLWDKYQDTGARLENVNRAAAFTKTYDETGSLLKAAFEANDLMPFQMRGTSQILFNLSRVVPFFNSRLQGLDKLARSATDPETRQRFWAVTGTYVALSLMAYMALKDDDDYEELEQWKRDAYHYFKVDGQLYKIPRPFEMGVLAMLVERTAEQVFKDVPASLWVDRVWSALGDTFAMNPVPQALKPVWDVYANRDSFTGRPIESLGMENRSKTQRKTPDSSYVGVGVSEALDALFKTMTLGKQETPLSPVQVDELVKGYLGWVGSFALAGSNMILDGLTGAPDKPEDIRRIPIVGDMLNAISESDTPRSTAYSSAFYDHLKIVRQAQADFNQARKLGDTRQMQDIRTDKQPAFAAKDAYNKAASSLTDINNMMQKIQAGNDPGDVKKRKLDELTRRKNRITQTIESRFGKTLETF